jgi:hypothetical protein
MGATMTGGGDVSGTEAPATASLGAALELDTSWRHLLWPSRRVERFVVSFPKSGRTWLRMMLAVAEARARGAEPEGVVREWLETDSPRLGGKRVLFTHALSANAHERADAMNHFLGYIGDRPRLFLVRDPRDTVVSYFFQVTKRQRVSSRAGDLGGFVRDPHYGIDRILEFLRSCDRSLTADPGPALLLSYEALHRDTRSALLRVLDFFLESASPEALDEALAFGQFERMQRLEREGAWVGNGRLVARDPGDPESLKTRRGVVGGHREYLVGDDLAYVERRIAERLPPSLGYLEPGAHPETRVSGSSS